MLILQKLRFLKLTQNSLQISQRHLRGLPRQTTVHQVNDEHSILKPAPLNVENLNTLSEESFGDKQRLPSLNDITEQDVNRTVSDELGHERNALKNYVPTFNLAAYVNKSPTLQELVKLGVNLHSIERRKGLAEFVLRLDFEKNIRPYLFFLQDQGVSPDLYGELITKNPLLFKVDLDDLQTRVNYLEIKKFTPVQRQRIFSINPYWLMFSTRRIDNRLGYFQNEFKLDSNNVRFLATKQPRLITYGMEHVQKSTFCIREEMGFNKDEIRCLLLSKPRLWMMNSDILIERFAFVHKEMGLSHDMLLQCPEVLISREFRLRQRHGFLKSLGRAQYNPEQDLYISPRTVVEGNDFHFVRNIAKSDMETYDLFLKTQ